jgi:biopolymer transport protein ExbB/TolQ
MSQNTTSDILNSNDQEAPKLSTGLNVLTILTFIGCAYDLYTTIKNFIGGKKALEEFEKAQEKLADAPAWAKKFASPEVHDLMLKSLDNKVPLMIIGLIATSLCLFGAIEMRKLKKQEYILWIIGELLPYIGLVIFTGTIFFQTFLVYFLFIPVIFILLYTFQRKNLVY